MQKKNQPNKHISLRPLRKRDLSTVAGGRVYSCGTKGDKCTSLVVVISATNYTVYL